MRKALLRAGAEYQYLGFERQKIVEVSLVECVEPFWLPVGQHLFRCDYDRLFEAFAADRDIAFAVGGENLLGAAGVEM